MPDITLLNEDCMTYMADLPDKAFDLAIVDPPYGIGVNANMGRRAGQENSNPAAEWDKLPPPAEYFTELVRVSQMQVIWGANHFIENMPWNARCWLLWDKKFSDELSFSQFEMAWTSFSGMSKKYDAAPSAGYAGGAHKKIHPTQKPVSLYRWILENYAKPGQRILDTHLGSGSSAIAAHYFGCDFVGTELDPDYYAAAVKRFEAETAQIAMELS